MRDSSEWERRGGEKMTTGRGRSTHGELAGDEDNVGTLDGAGLGVDGEDLVNDLREAHALCVCVCRHGMEGGTWEG